MRIDGELPLIRRVTAQLRTMLGDDDDVAFLDTLEGETNALEILDALIGGVQEADAMAEALRLQIDALSSRRARMVQRKDAFRSSILAVIDATGLQKIERPLATVSRRAGQPSVVITDAAAVPSQLCKTTVAPDLAAIKAQLAAGEAVPGAGLYPGPEILTVRVK